MQNTIYRIKWEDKAEEELEKLPADIALKIYSRVQNHLTQAPKELGKALTGKYRGLYRYRYGDYRIMYEIDIEERLIIINRIGHRKEIY